MDRGKECECREGLLDTVSRADVGAVTFGLRGPRGMLEKRFA
jgi:hypothetical protein